MIIELTIPGAVRGKGRPRFARAGNFVRTYTDEKTASYENLIKMYAAKAMTGSIIFEEALKVQIMISMIPPKGFTKKKRLDAIEQRIFPTVKPDLDNVGKIMLDAMNGIVYLDDKQVVDLQISKHYSEKAEAWLMISPMAEKISNLL